MSDYLGAASQKLGAPEDIVMRSAQARASAEGVSVEDVLRAWAGGAEVAPAPPEAPTAEAAAAPAAVEEVEEAQAPVAPPAPTPGPAPPPTPVPIPIVVEVLVEEEEPVDVPSLSNRVKPPATLGALVGLVLGMAGILFASTWLIGSTSTTAGEVPSPVWLVSPVAVIIAAASISVVVGGLAGVLSRGVPTYAHPGARLRMSPTSSFVVGAMVGLVLGAVSAGLLLGALGESVEITVDGEPQTRTLLPLFESLLVILVGGSVLGAASAAAPHLIGMPAALRGEDAEGPAVVRKRMSTAILAPLTAIGVVGLMVIAFSRVLLAWPQFAPVVATLIALGILGFGSLMRLIPGTRVRRGDVYAALSGLAVIFIVILAVLLTWGGSGDSQGEPSESESAAISRVV